MKANRVDKILSDEELRKNIMREMASRGGKAASANLTPEQRKERARKAVAARESRKPKPAQEQP